MVLDQFGDGASRRLLVFDDDTRRLAYMLLLPLFDGVFATLLVSGYLQSVTGMLNVAFTIFAGAGALTVVYSEAGTAERARKMVLKVAPLLLIGGVLTGIFAPAFKSLLHIGRLEMVSGLAVAVIALQIAGVRKAEKIPVPLLIASGILLSFNPGVKISVTGEYLVPSLLTVSTAITGLLIASCLEDRINVDYMRRGGVAVLLIISASLLGLNIPSGTGLAVLAVTVAASFKF